MKTTDDGRKRLRFDFRIADTHPETECESAFPSYATNKIDLARGYKSIRIPPAKEPLTRRIRMFYAVALTSLLIPILLNLCLVERSQVANTSAHKFLNDVLTDDAVGIAYAGHFEDMPLSAIRAAQNFHRTEFLDNVEKAKTYAARAVESRRIADKAFTSLTKIIALLDPTDMTDEERIVQSKYREVEHMSQRLRAMQLESQNEETATEPSKEVEMTGPDQE